MAKKDKQKGVWVDEKVAMKLERIKKHFADLNYDESYSDSEAIRTSIMMANEMLDLLKEYGLNKVEDLKQLLKKK